MGLIKENVINNISHILYNLQLNGPLKNAKCYEL